MARTVSSILTNDRLFAVRDPIGVRPLCLGKLGGNWVVASESCALMTVGAEFVREVEPGEIVEIDGNGLTSHLPAGAEQARDVPVRVDLFCPAGQQLINQRLHLVRQRMGAELAEEHPGRRGHCRRLARFGDAGRHRLCQANRHSL